MTFAASRVPHSLRGRDMSPSSRVESEFMDARSRPLSSYSVTESSRPPSIAPGPPSSYPSRPSSYAPHGNLLTAHAFGTPNASRSSHDITSHYMEPGVEVHRGRSFEPMSPILSEPRSRRRSRSSHVSMGVSTRRRSKSKASSGRSHRRQSRVPNTLNMPIPHLEDSPAQRGRSPLPAESTDIDIELQSASRSGVTSSIVIPELIPTDSVNRYERGITMSFVCLASQLSTSSDGRFCRPKKNDEYQCIIPPKSLTFPR